MSSTRWRLAALFALMMCAFRADAAITITTTLPGYYSAGKPIQGVLFQATGATSSLQWTISAGTTPPGLTFDSTGHFAGTPSLAGTYTFTVRAAAPQEPTNPPGTKTFTVGVPQITTASPLPPATIGVPYSIQFQTSDAPPTGAVWSVSLGGLPLGPTIDNKTGIYSGTPLRAGTFDLAVSVSYAEAFATKTIQITINAPASQPFTVAPSALQFTVVAGDTTGPQNLTVSSVASSPVNFTVAVDDGKGGPAPVWLKVLPKGGTTPGVLHVSLVPASLATGTYNARIRIGLATTAANLPTTDIPVTLNVTNPPPNLTTAPSLLRFRARVNNPGSLDQTFVLSNIGGSGPVPFSVSVAGKSSWITAVNVSAPTIRVNDPAEITVTVNTQGLAAGSYRDAIHVTTPVAAPFDQFDVPVTLVIAGAGSILSVPINGVRFATQQGNQSSRTQQIFVRNPGDPGSAVNWSAQAVRGADLVTLINPRGTSTPGNPSTFGIRLSSTAASTPGGKFALIQITDPQSQNSPQFVVVVADVAAAGTPPTVDPDPSGLFFVGTSGGAAPAAQQVTVNTNSSAPVAFSVAASTDNGINWLSATTASATTSQTNPAQVTVSVTPGVLAAGLYSGTVNIGIGPVVSSVTVTMFLKPAGSVAAFEGRAAGCNPTSVLVAQTGIVDNFSVPAGWPATLAVQVGDNCGNALTSASVAASFSNGDPPISLVGDEQSATYSATWQPGNATSEMTVTIDAASGSLTPARMQLSGNVNPNTSPAPSLVAGGFLNNLNAVVGAPLAPGTVTQVYGDNLAASASSPTTVPLPNSFQGVEAIVGGLSAPLFYVSKTQLVVQVPSELAPNKTYSGILVANGQYTLPQPVDLVAANPGTVAFSDGRLVAQHGDYTLVDSSRPAKPGETLTIYLVGMGATNPAVPSGAPAPVDPLARVPGVVKVVVDGQPAVVSFAGLTPGGVGLYQINFAVPAVRSGTLDVVITQDGVAANATQLVVQ
jgi:uncharacterized protein (TIGR03437 family)